MKENADDLLLELGKRGFSATLQHDQVQGRDRWRVLAGSGLDRDAERIGESVGTRCLRRDDESAAEQRAENERQ